MEGSEDKRKPQERTQCCPGAPGVATLGTPERSATPQTRGTHISDVPGTSTGLPPKASRSILAARLGCSSRSKQAMSSKRGLVSQLCPISVEVSEIESLLVIVPPASSAGTALKLILASPSISYLLKIAINSYLVATCPIFLRNLFRFCWSQ